MPTRASAKLPVRESTRSIPFNLAALQAAYRNGEAQPADVIRAAYRRIAEAARPDVWISIRPEAEAVALAETLARQPPDMLPLYGVPFAAKDNIDVAGLPTTAACASYAYQPDESAACVAALEQAGAICIGKANLDQFATGLSGVRSPYGACGSAVDRSVIAGGSSSGSAVAVALERGGVRLGHRHRWIGPDSGRVQQRCRAETDHRRDLDPWPCAKLPHA